MAQQFEHEIRTWCLSKLKVGGPLEGAVARTFDQAAVRVVAGPGSELHPRLNESVGSRQSATDRELANTLSAWVKSTPLLLIVLNDLARPGNVVLPDGIDGTAIADRSIYHWWLLVRENVGQAPSFIRSAASGYPTIAHIGPASAADILRSEPLDQDSLRSLAADLWAGCVAAYDDEAYVLWEDTQRLSQLERVG